MTTTASTIPAEFEGLIDPSPLQSWSNIFFISFIHNGKKRCFCIWPHNKKDLVTSEHMDVEMRTAHDYTGDAISINNWMDETGIDGTGLGGYSIATMNRKNVIDIVEKIRQKKNGFTVKPLTGFTICKKPEKPCPRCGRMNDIGVKECWHCVMPNP